MVTMAYTLNVKYTDANGKLEEHPLTGPHTLDLNDVASPLAVQLIPIPGDNTYDLHVTAKSETEKEHPTGVGPYEIFIGHENSGGGVLQACLANGPHFMVLNPEFNKLTATLANMPEKHKIPTRMFLSLTDKP
jgi:hypothetical protein